MPVSTIRWDETIRSVGRGAKARRKFAANRSRNWLLALYSLACAKREAGKALSDLESHLVHTLLESSVGEQLIHALAHVQQATPSDLRHQIFPDRFAALNVGNAVSFADLAQMAPAIVAGVLGQPNVRDLDIAEIHAGPRLERDPMRMPALVLGQHASSLVRAVMPEQAVPIAPAPIPPVPPKPIANRYTIKALGFRCLEESNESSAHDEVYWLFGSVAKGFHMTNGTHTFTGVDADDHFDFNSNEGCFWGMDCQPHLFPDGDIGATATLIEHDHGDQSDVLKGWTTAFLAAGGILTASGAAAWATAVLAGIGAIGGWIIGTFEDDHIADASWTWNRASINEVVGKHGGSFDVTQNFTDGDANYRLRIRISRVV